MSNKEAVTTVRRCQLDPAFFAREILGVTLWDKQIEIMEAVRDYPKVAVKAGHNVGKTFVAACVVLQRACSYYDSTGITTSATFAKVKKLLWAEIGRLYANSLLPLGGECITTELNFGPKWTYYGASTKYASSFQGDHSQDNLVIFDEAQGSEQIPKEIWDASDSMASSEGSRWLVIGNPLDPSGPFFDCFSSPEWHCITISCLDHPNVVQGKPVIPASVSPDWVEEKKRTWGEDSALYQSRVLGVFPDGGDTTAITISMLEHTADQEMSGTDRHIGFDIARFGMDSNVMALSVGGRIEQIAKWSGTDLMETAGRGIAKMKEWGVVPENVHVDECGLGGGVVDRMREQGYSVDGVNAGGRAAGDHRDLTLDIQFANRRAEMYWVGRMLLQSGQLSIPRKHAQAWSELTVSHYRHNSNGDIVMESKDAMKKRLGGSPDESDAILLSCARTNQMAWEIL